MKYVQNDSFNNIKLSKIGLGTGKFGTKIEEKQAFQMLDFFVEHGGTTIDTARNYYEWVENGRGKSEECIGRWMDKCGNRNKVCIITKGGVRNEGNKWYINLTEENLLEEVKQSLEALKTDYLDVYLLHRDEKNHSIEEIVETMQEVKEVGDIRYIGVANWEYKRVKAANEYAKKMGMEPFRIVQTWWSLAEYTKEMWNDKNTTHMDNEMYDYLLENSYVGMAYTSQCKGYFQKAIQSGVENVDSFLRSRIETDVNLKKLNYIKWYCEEKQISPTAAVCSYITDNPVDGIALVSTSSMKQLEDIVEWCDYKVNEEFINSVNQIQN